MALIGSIKGSNALDNSGSNGPGEDSGDPAKCGYTVVTADGDPAMSNSDISSDKATVGAGNDGTNMGSYQFQTDILSSMKGMPASGKK